MQIFSSNSKGIVTWGPTASVNVSIGALGSIVDDTWILVGLSMGMKEITDVRQCFDDVSYIYALGNDQGNCVMELSFAVFIGRRECQGGDNTSAMNDGIAAYLKSRISKNPEGSTITIGGLSGKGWLTGLNMGGLDPERGICRGTVQFIIELAS